MRAIRIHEFGGVEQMRLEQVEQPQPKAGEVLIKNAAGGVGSMLVQLAKHSGAKVIGTASSADKLAKAIELGADVGINYTESDWAEQVLHATNGKGVDVIIEMVGGDIGRQNLSCLAT